MAVNVSCRIALCDLICELSKAGQWLWEQLKVWTTLQISNLTRFTPWSASIRFGRLTGDASVLFPQSPFWPQSGNCCQRLQKGDMGRVGALINASNANLPSPTLPSSEDYSSLSRGATSKSQKGDYNFKTVCEEIEGTLDSGSSRPETLTSLQEWQQQQQ